MTREEEIREEIDLQLVGSFGDDYTEGYEEGFIKGAKWADEKMIEKACKWLINIDFDGDQNFRDCDESFNNDLLVDAFRRAMGL